MSLSLIHISPTLIDAAMAGVVVRFGLEEMCIRDRAYTDPENEAVVQDAVARLARNKTLVVIAHRLSTVTHADAIAVMDDGRVVACDTHENLLETCPLYASMWAAHESVRDVA